MLTFTHPFETAIVEDLQLSNKASLRTPHKLEAVRTSKSAEPVREERNAVFQMTSFLVNQGLIFQFQA